MIDGKLVLIIEDEKKLLNALKQGLSEEGASVFTATTGSQARDIEAKNNLELIILDLSLPDCDGLDLLSVWRNSGKEFPVLIISARDDVPDRVKGLDEGADDYLCKPFAFEEMLSRVRALLRRSCAPSDINLDVDNDLTIDLLTREVRRDGRLIALTAIEYDLLVSLVRNKNAVISRQELMSNVWREISRATSPDNLIDVHMSHLRSKIDSEFAVKLIKSVRGHGFMIKEMSQQC